ncbi:MAG: Uncharacterised protein [Owenweeksia sp. TMED14]|nr:MAG: Uncharacterised protein [Owenweeksia sp. TMED14]|tara:strand:- start:2958 stop:3326 length:369 start_codon:yes stop_codon:yes gene_type:complete
MKNWIILLLFGFIVASCATPKATILQKSSSIFVIAVEKKANSPMDIVDVQLSDGSQWVSGSFQYTDKNGMKNGLLNTKGYDSFGLKVSTPELSFDPIKAMISYRTEKDGVIKSFLVEFDSNN